MASISLVDLLWYANVTALALLLIRLVRQNLLWTYRMLCLYLVIDIAQQVAGIAVSKFIKSAPVSYFQIYAAGQALKVVLIVFVVLELYRIALKEYPAVGRYVRNVAAYMMLGAAVVAAGLLWLTPPRLNHGSPWIRLESVHGFERTLDSMSLFLLLFVAAFLLWFPVRLSRNIAWCLGCFSAYLCARWIGLFEKGPRPDLRLLIDNGMLTVSLVCFTTMAYAMAWKMEKRTVSAEGRWNAKRMQRLRATLDALENCLAGFAKKTRNITENPALHSPKL